MRLTSSSEIDQREAVGLLVRASQATGEGASTARLNVSSPTASPTNPAPSTPVSAPVKRSEVVAAFKAYFAERAAADVMVGKAVTKLKFTHGVIKVTFDPAAAEVSQAVFNSTKAFDDPCEVRSDADRIFGRDRPSPATCDLRPATCDQRPAIDRIRTVLPDGISLGSFSRTDILVLNELDGVKSTQLAAPSEEAEPTSTTRGVMETDAVIACARFGDAAFPYGFKDNSILGVINHEIVRNRWFIKHEATSTNAYDAERDSVFECTVGGTHANPRVKAFAVSN